VIATSASRPNKTMPAAIQGHHDLPRMTVYLGPPARRVSIPVGCDIRMVVV
jgi:hypothetical protein